MALSFFQKLRIGFRGWSRRREQKAEQRNREFVAKSTNWGAKAGVPAAAVPQNSASPAVPIDLEGLQVAFLDDSGRMDHYLDMQTGEVIEFLSQDRERHPEVKVSASRYRRVPTRDAKSDAEDRQTFPGTLEPSAIRDALSRVPASDAAGFRRAIAADRTIERRWYSFKNDRATEAIQHWLREKGADG